MITSSSCPPCLLQILLQLILVRQQCDQGLYPAPPLEFVEKALRFRQPPVSVHFLPVQEYHFPLDQRVHFRVKLVPLVRQHVGQDLVERVLLQHLVVHWAPCIEVSAKRSRFPRKPARRASWLQAVAAVLPNASVRPFGVVRNVLVRGLD
jgi:hypothetical protein